LNILKNFTYDNTIFLIGNKSDLKEERKVAIEEGKKFKNDYDNIIIFFETSAENGENIDKLFEKVGFSIYEKNEADEKKLDKANKRSVSLIKEDFTKNNEKKKKKEKGKCC